MHGCNRAVMPGERKGGRNGQRITSKRADRTDTQDVLTTIPAVRPWPHRLSVQVESAAHVVAPGTNLGGAMRAVRATRLHEARTADRRYTDLRCICGDPDLRPLSAASLTLTQRRSTLSHVGNAAREK